MPEIEQQEDFMHPHLKMFLKVMSQAHAPMKIIVDKLKDGDLVEVQKLNILYKLKIINPKNHLVEAESNGEYPRSRKKLRILGAIAEGHGILLEATKRNASGMVETITTSPVQKITVNGVDVTGKVLCQASGTRCNICGGQFPECDDICSLGGHQIGKYYPIPANLK